MRRQPEGEWFPQRFRLGSRRRGIRVTDEGLTEVLRRRRPVFVPWGNLLRVDWRESGATIWTTDHELRLDGRLKGWRRLAMLASRRLAAEGDGAEQEQVPAEQIAEWLGIAPDEALVCRTSLKRYSWTLMLLLTVVLGAFVNPVLAIEALLAFILVAVVALKSARTVVADVHGLTVGTKGQRRRIPWAQIDSVRIGGSGWLVTSDEGEFTIDPSLPHAQRLAETLRQVVQARNAGRHLPALGPVPEGAISLMARGSAEGLAERGVSRPGESGEA